MKKHLTFPKFTISDDIPVNEDLRIRLGPLTEENWKILNTMCEGTPIHDLDLDHFEIRLDIVNEVLRGRVMTRAQKRSQFNKLKQALSQHTQAGLLNNNSSNIFDNFVDSSDINFDATRNSSSATDNDSNNATHDSSSKDKYNCDFDLSNNYLCGGLPDKLMMEALKELNISDIKDFLNHNHDKSKPFEKQKCAPPPQYHLESSRGDVKDRLTAFQHQSYFGGRQLKGYTLLSKLGTRLSVVDND